MAFGTTSSDHPGKHVRAARLQLVLILKIRHNLTFAEIVIGQAVTIGTDALGGVANEVIGRDTDDESAPPRPEDTSLLGHRGVQSGPIVLVMNHVDR